VHILFRFGFFDRQQTEAAMKAMNQHMQTHSFLLMKPAQQVA
jgi:hypothetical protein